MKSTVDFLMELFSKHPDIGERASFQSHILSVIRQAQAEAYAAGQKAMREAAADACWPCPQDYAPSIPTEHVAKRLSDYIRAIPIQTLPTEEK